jgi:HK97 family phage major capsid protein
MTLASLREARASQVDAIRAVVSKAASENRDLSDQEQAAFDTGKAEVEKLEGRIRNAEFLADVERRETGKVVSLDRVRDENFETECREFSIVRAIASQIPGLNVDAGREREVSRELERRAGRPSQGMLVPTKVFEKRIVTTVTPAGGPGANVIATDWRGDQFIDRLRETMAVRRLGARVLSGLVGNVDIPRLKASGTAYWVAENQAITVSDPQFDKVSLTPKHVGVLTEVSRNMLLQSSPDIEDILRDDFAQCSPRPWTRRQSKAAERTSQQASSRQVACSTWLAGRTASRPPIRTSSRSSPQSAQRTPSRARSAS